MVRWKPKNEINSNSQNETIIAQKERHAKEQDTK
jgi:hypothetical protein